FDNLRFPFIKIASDAEFDSCSFQRVVLSLLNAHFVMSVSGAYAFPRYAVYRYRDRYGYDVADLLDALNPMHPVRRRIVENVCQRLPLDVIDHLDIAIAVAPAFALLHKLRIDISSQCRKR